MRFSPATREAAALHRHDHLSRKRPGVSGGQLIQQVAGITPNDKRLDLLAAVAQPEIPHHPASADNDDVTQNGIAAATATPRTHGTPPRCHQARHPTAGDYDDARFCLNHLAQQALEGRPARGERDQLCVLGPTHVTGHVSSAILHLHAARKHRLDDIEPLNQRRAKPARKPWQAGSAAYPAAATTTTSPPASPAPPRRHARTRPHSHGRHTP